MKRSHVSNRSLMVVACASAVLSVVSAAFIEPEAAVPVGAGLGAGLVLFGVVHRHHRHLMVRLDEGRLRHLKILEGLARLDSRLNESHDRAAQAVASVDGIAHSMQSELDELTQRFELAARHESDRIERMLGRSERSLRRQIDDVFDQHAAVHELRELDLFDLPLPPLRRWAISPDLALHIVTMILDGQVSDVLELGSGSSTILFGRAIKTSGRPGRVVAFDHDAEYVDRTNELIVRHGLADVCSVHYAPLVDFQMGSDSIRWYDVDAGGVDGHFQLLFVDGPPEATGPLARWPAVPKLSSLLAPGARIILDDGDRPDEREAARLWLERDDVVSAATLDVERAAIELRTAD